MKFKTPYNIDYDVHEPGRFEPDQDPESSITIPGQEMSVQEIMQRYANGLSLTNAKVPIYEGDEIDFPDLKRMDISERYDALEKAKQDVIDLQAKLNQQQKEERARQQQRVPVHPDDQGTEDDNNEIQYPRNTDRRSPSSPAGNEANETQSSKQSKQQSKKIE